MTKSLTNAPEQGPSRENRFSCLSVRHGSGFDGGDRLARAIEQGFRHYLGNVVYDWLEAECERRGIKNEYDN